MQKPVVLQASINGVDVAKGGHFPSTPQEIAKVALDCIGHGAAIIHNHVNRVNCSAEDTVDRYLEGWRLIFAQRPDALVFPSIHYGPAGRYSYEHIEPLARSGMLKMSFCDVGSPCFFNEVRNGIAYGAHVYVNSLNDVAERLEQHGRLGIGTVINVYEVTGLRNFLLTLRAGRAPQGCSVNLNFAVDVEESGALGFVGLPPSAAMVDLCLDMIRGTDLPWGVTLFGGDPVSSGLASMVLRKGGNLTVGLEPFGGPRTPTNIELVDEAADLCRREGRPLATPAEAAILLGLPCAAGKTISN